MPTFFPCLHGQSIKTRVEAGTAHMGLAVPGVYTDNPLKQGLKLVNVRVQGKYIVLSTQTIH